MQFKLNEDKTMIVGVSEMEEPSKHYYNIGEDQGKIAPFNQMRFMGDMKAYREHVASLSSYQASPELVEWMRNKESISEGEFELKSTCPACDGDGKLTCNNPDHGFIVTMGSSDIVGSGSYEMGRLGCPGCGHDPKHKVPNGGDCDVCNGTGFVTKQEIETFCKETGFDDYVEEVAYPKQEVKEDEENRLWAELMAAIHTWHTSEHATIKDLKERFTVTRKTKQWNI